MRRGIPRRPCAAESVHAPSWRRWSFCVCLAALAAAAVQAAETPDQLAARILQAVGRPVGLAELPRCGDGQLALALAGADANLCLHGQDADEGKILQARRGADAKGWLGRRVWFDPADTSRLLLAGHSADLIVLTDLAAGDLTKALAAEIRRVLHPWYGQAVLGDASGRLDAAALRQWAGTAFKTVALVPGEGTFVIARADPLSGADDWAMWWHGPDNNSVSGDTAFHTPCTIQWTGKPYFGPTRLELPIVADGRLFMLWNGDEMDSSSGRLRIDDAPPGDGPLLTAQAIGSGARLWVRRLSPAAWVQVSRSIVVADGEKLLVADGSNVLELEAATGKEIRHKTLDCPEIKWMTRSDGRLFILGGTVTQSFGHRSEKAVTPFRTSGLNLIALDRKTFAQVWRVDREAGKDAFDPRSPAIDGDRLFIAGEGDAAEAYDAASGKRLWTSTLGFERSRVVGYDWDRSSRHPVTGYAFLGVYVISGLEMKDAVVVSQTDGKPLWTQKQPGAGQFMPLSLMNLIWNGDQSLAPLTGKPLGKMPVGGLLISRAGAGRDFAMSDKVDLAADPGADEKLYGQLRMVQGSTVYTVENLSAATPYTIRLHLFEPWDDKAGQRLMDVSVNGEEAAKGLDVFAAAGGKDKAVVRDLPAKADADGRVTIQVAATPGCPDASPLLSGIEIREGDRSLAVFPASGNYAPVQGFHMLRASCSRDTAAPFLEQTAYHPRENLKSSCDAGTFVADGLLWKFPVPCVNCTEWRGFIPQAPSEAALPAPPARLQGKAPAPAAAEPRGWLAYRANAQRSLSAATAAPVTATVRWQTPALHPSGCASSMIDPEFVPAPPVAADQRVIVARAEGSVEALDLATGRRLWRVCTSGRVQSSPAVWRDRVFVGSTDGHLYAFALADGRELWRLRVAPDAGRIMVYGQLGSRWPVVGSPVVVGDTVVASAGLVGMVDGVYAVCADAASGKIEWERSDWKDSEAAGYLSGGAQFALDGGQLFYHGGLAPPIRISPADGTTGPALPATICERFIDKGGPGKWKSCQAFNAVVGAVKGQDIGGLSPEWLMYGGRRIWTDQAEDGSWRATIKILGRDPQGRGRLPVINVEHAERLPAWDEQGVLFFCDRGFGKARNLSGFVLIPHDRIEKALSDLTAGTDTAKVLAIDDERPKNGMSVPPEMFAKTFDPTAEGLSAWGKGLDYGWSALAYALTPNAALLATKSWDEKLKVRARLTAVSRADGSTMWEVNLPALPVHDGLAVAADGSVVLTLVDGETLCVGPAGGA